MLIFEWDPDKARDSEQKHRVSFPEASEVFDDDHLSSVSDPDHSDERTVTSSSVFLNRVSIWLCPILSAETEFG